MPFKARRSGNYASPCWFISRSFHWQRTRPESSNIYSQLLYTYNVCLCAYVAKIVDLSSARIAFRLQFHFVNTFLELVVTQTLKGNDDNDNYRCRLCSESAITSAMSSDLNRERSGSPNRINSYADLIRISAGSLPNCCGFIILSASVILPNVVKIDRWLHENANKSNKIPYSAMVMKVQKWPGILIWDRIIIKSYSVLLIGRSSHNSKFHWNRLIMFAIILLTDRQTGRQTKRQTERIDRIFVINRFLWSHLKQATFVSSNYARTFPFWTAKCSACSSSESIFR